MKHGAAAATWREIEKELEAAGWTVTHERVWGARARRDKHVEDGIAVDLDDAYAELQQLTRLDDDEGGG